MFTNQTTWNREDLFSSKVDVTVRSVKSDSSNNNGETVKQQGTVKRQGAVKQEGTVKQQGASSLPEASPYTCTPWPSNDPSVYTGLHPVEPSCTGPGCSEPSHGYSDKPSCPYYSARRWKTEGSSLVRAVYSIW